MRHVINITGYLLVVAGGSFIAWLIYGILAETYLADAMEVNCAGIPRSWIVITSPANRVVSQPMIQITGFFPEEIKEITYDITNATSTNKKQTDCRLKGYVTGQCFDRAKFDRTAQERSTNRFKPWNPVEKMALNDSAVTTNFFQLSDVRLAPGDNRIRIHITGRNGLHYVTRRYYTLD